MSRKVLNSFSDMYYNQNLLMLVDWFADWESQIFKLRLKTIQLL